ncbi:MAG: glycosyltransferase [Planctomycetota bacterium]
MHLAWIADTRWLEQEVSQLHHLVVGLIDESVRVTQVLPRGRAEHGVTQFAERLPWNESRLAPLNRQRLAQLAEPLRARKITLLHGVGASLWPATLRLARQLDVPAVLAGHGVSDAEAVRSLPSRAQSSAVAVVLPSEGLADVAREAAKADVLIHVAPLGVHPGSAEPRPLPGAEPGRRLSLAVSGTGRLDPGYSALLDALAQLAPDMPDLQVFFEGMGAEQHEIWRAGRRLGLLPHMTLAPAHLARRELLLRADALLLPQALGRCRSLPLQAMASGLPVLAAVDPACEEFQQGRTAWLLEDPTPEGWLSLLRRLADRPDDARGLARTAQQWVREHRLASTQVAGLLDLYRVLLGQNHPFPATASDREPAANPGP